MSDETRTQRYDGLYPSQVQEAFAADAAQAAASGWYPVTQQWVGTTLVVTYAQGRPMAAPATGQPAATVVARTPKRSRPVLWVSAAVLVLLAVGVTQAGHPKTPASSGPAAPSVARDACDAAMAYAASFDRYSDTSEQLDPAFSACASSVAWIAASERYPDALDGADPAEYLSNSCSPDSGRGLTETAVCRSLGAAAPTPTPRATPVPTPRITAVPQATAKPQPARTARPAATPRVSGFGTRDEIVSFWEDLGFTGGMSDLNTGEKRWLGRDDSSDMVEVTGPADGVTSLSLTVAVSNDTADSAGTLMGLWLITYAPGSTDYVSNGINRLAAGGSGGSKRFGHVRVGVDGILATDGMIVIVTLDHD